MPNISENDIEVGIFERRDGESGRSIRKALMVWGALFGRYWGVSGYFP
jgi:hypothetical protein